MLQNIPAYSVEVVQDFVIGISKHREAQTVQIGVPLAILFCRVRLIVLRSVQLDDDAGGVDTEINNAGADHVLPLDRNIQTFQKIVPQMPFFPCHVFAQLLCVSRVKIGHRSHISTVEMLIVISSSTSSRALTVSRAVKIVTLFSVATRRIWAPSLSERIEPMSLVLMT